MGNAAQGWRSDQHVATMPSNPREDKGDRRLPLLSRPSQTCLPPEDGRSGHSRVRRLIRLKMVRTERAADPIGHYAHLVATDTEHTGDVIAETEDALAADMQCKMPPRRVVFGKRGTRLDRVYDDSVAASSSLVTRAARAKAWAAAGLSLGRPPTAAPPSRRIQGLPE